MQDIETGTLLMDWNALYRAGKSHAELFVRVSHQLNSFADCERNTSECVQSTRQIRKCRKVCFPKPANGLSQQGSSEREQRDGILADGFLHRLTHLQKIQNGLPFGRPKAI